MFFNTKSVKNVYHLLRQSIFISQNLRFSSQQPLICIIGSGPSGFVVAQTLLKNNETLKVDIYEKQPIPFGLVRYGVAPDHQDVKNCINGYNKTAQSDRLSFFGNVTVGKDITLSKLCDLYHAVVVCTGAQEEQKLGIPGENLNNVLTSNQFVGWYNGVPEYQNLDIDLTGDTAVVVGVGNVALDVVRTLLKPVDQLANTDITTEAVDKLSRSNIKNVFIFGRRGPLQMACTRKELSLITDLSGVATFIEPEHFDDVVQEALKKNDLKLRKQQRLVSYLQKVALPVDGAVTTATKKFFVKLLRTPIRMISEAGDGVTAIEVRKHRMKGEDSFQPIITETQETEVIKCNLVVTCIGYGIKPVDATLIPFENGKFYNTNGRVNFNRGLYTCGWCSRGPVGTLADSSNDSLLTGSTILSDLPKLLANKSTCYGSSAVLKILAQKNVSPVTWDGWENINHHEIERGEKVGKIREKMLDVKEMISLASS